MPQGAGALRDPLDQDAGYARNLSLLAAPPERLFRLEAAARHQHRPLAGPFVRRGGRVRQRLSVRPGRLHETLTALHLPIALWLVVGIAYAGGRWGEVAGRMDFIRFSGELFIYYVLIALGGVLMASMRIIFQSIGIDLEPFFESWLLPWGGGGRRGRLLAGGGQAERDREHGARVDAPLHALFAAVLVTFLGTLLWTGRGVDIGRNALIAFDLLLVVVLGLLLYSVSARDPRAPPGAFDVVQVVLVVSALLADAVALWAIAARITEFGFTPNRVAALGENVVLLVNLAWSAVLYIRFLRGRGSFTGLERWQTNYMLVYAVWAAIVVIVFPPVFGYIDGVLHTFSTARSRTVYTGGHTSRGSGAIRGHLRMPSETRAGYPQPSFTRPGAAWSRTSPTSATNSSWRPPNNKEKPAHQRTQQ